MKKSELRQMIKEELLKEGLLNEMTISSRIKSRNFGYFEMKVHEEDENIVMSVQHNGKTISETKIDIWGRVAVTSSKKSVKLKGSRRG